MNRSFKLFSVSGIDLKLHITFPIILVWAAWQFWAITGNLSGAFFGVVAITLLFVLVTLHELGHSFAARHYNIPVSQIVLSPIGGVAQLTRIPDKPMQEFVIAIAGPAVNVAIALLMTLVAWAAGLNLQDALIAISRIDGFAVATLFYYIFVYNIFLALFNLIPAFPMDGGRVLRALLAMRLEYAQATRIAATIGRVLAVAFGIWGLLNGGFFQIMIAIFIFSAATQEAKFANVRADLKQYRVQQVVQTNGMRLEPQFTLQQAASLMALRQQPAFPVVVGDELVGWVDGRVLQQALQSRPSYTPVSEIMDRAIKPVQGSDDLFAVQMRLQEEGRSMLPVVSAADMFGRRRYLGLISSGHIHAIYQMAKKAPTSAPTPRSV